MVGGTRIWTHPRRELLVKEERELIRQRWGWGDEKEHLDRWGAINTVYVSFSSKQDRESNAF